MVNVSNKKLQPRVPPSNKYCFTKGGETMKTKNPNIIPEGFYRKGYKIKIYPTEAQCNYIDRCIELSAFVYNWTLDTISDNYTKFLNGETDKKFLSEFDLQHLLSEYRNENIWLQDITLTMGRYQIRNALRAFEGYFKHRTKRPKYKSKKKSKKFIFLRPERFYFEDNMLRIEGLPFGDKIYTGWHSNYHKKDNIEYVTPQITRTNLGEYFVSFCLIRRKPVEYFEEQKIEPMQSAIGIDLNVKDRFVCSNGYRSGSPNIDSLIRKEKKYNKICQKDYKRRRKQEISNPDNARISNRAIKRLNRYRKNYKKIQDTIDTFIQQETKKIINMHPTAIVMEHLSVHGMEKVARHKSHTGKHIHHAKFYQCRRTMQNKCNKYNIPFILAPKTYPSSQLCSNCGNRKKIYTSKTYICPVCGLRIDRDLNAAINLKKLAYE